MKVLVLASLPAFLLLFDRVKAFGGIPLRSRHVSQLYLSNEPTDDEEASRLRKQAEELRESIKKMEEELGDSRPRNYDAPKVEVENEESYEM